MILFKPTITDLTEFVDIYISVAGNQILPLDRNVSISNIRQKYLNKAFIRGLKDENGITGFILGEPVQHPHLSFIVMQQMYFASNYKGIKAAKAVIILHKALYDFAELRHIPMVMSTGSFLDENNVFTKILEKQGWSRTGYLACKKTSYWKD